MWGKIFFLYVLYQSLGTSTFILVTTVLLLVSSYWTNGNSLRQKIRISSFKASNSGTIYLKSFVDVSQTLEYIKQKNQGKDPKQKITITHITGLAIGHTYKLFPNINGRVLLGRFVPRKTVDACFLVTVGDKNLGYSVIRDIPNKSLESIAIETNKEVSDVKEEKQKEYKSNMSLARLLPGFALGVLGNFMGFLCNCVGVDMPFGAKANFFGSFVITNIGVLGIEEAYVPFMGAMHVNCLASMGAIKDKPVVENGEVTIKPIMKIVFTVDHRYIDGSEGAKVLKTIHSFIQDPKLMENLKN